MHVRAGRNRVGVTGARDDDEFGFAHHVLPAMPGADFGERVGADDEEDLPRVRLRFHALDGMDRITLFAAGLQTRWNEARLPGAGQLHHLVAILEAGPSFLVRRIRGWDE